MTFAAAAPNHAFFAALQFKSGTSYIWQGFRPVLIDGITWQPVGPKATIEEMEDPVGDNVPTITMKVSGVDNHLLAKALASSDEIRNQLVFIYDMFFNRDWQQLSKMAVYAVVRMDTIKITKQRNEDGSWDQVIAISCENYLTNGPSPPNGRYSNADQWARQGNDNDLYFQYMQINQNRRQRWPTF